MGWRGAPSEEALEPIERTGITFVRRGRTRREYVAAAGNGIKLAIIQPAGIICGHSFGIFCRKIQAFSS